VDCYCGSFIAAAAVHGSYLTIEAVMVKKLILVGLKMSGKG